METSVFNLAGKLRISYDVPHRISSCKLYPLKAPNGSTIIIYGHDQGIRIVWRGGRTFKHPQASAEKPVVNGSNKEDAMVLDSDDDEPVADDSPSVEDFEPAQKEGDSSETDDDILRQIDLHCGTCVYHLAVPYLPSYITDSTPGAFPPILLGNIVVAAACSDTSIRLITLPLLPPHPSVNDMTYRAVQVVTIGSPNTHRVVPSAIGITHSATLENWARPTPSPSESRNRLSEEENRNKVSQRSGRKWCFLVASVSTSAGGLLLAHQIPLESDKRLSTSPKDTSPFQRCYLAASVLHSKVLFNPTAFPADRHSTLLVSLADSGCVKMMQFHPDDRSETIRGRRDSTATNDSAGSNLHASPVNSKSNGRHLMTLSAGFNAQSEGVSISRRKRILDVDWVASGGAMVVLLEDGEWGVWDLQGVGPDSRPGNLFQGQNNMSGIQGGALTKFALGGRVTAAVDTSSKTPNFEPDDRKGRALAPMTPHTRKVRGNGLFEGLEESLKAEVGTLQSVRGYICVTEHAPSKLSSLSTAEESIILAHGPDVIYISSLQALWRAETSSKGTFDSIETIRPSPLRDLALEHERVIAIAELPPRSSANTKVPLRVTGRDAPDVLVAGDRRLLLFVSLPRDSTVVQETTTQRPLRLATAHKSGLASRDEKSLLSRGELGVEGMDRILDDMGQQNDPSNGFLGRFKKSVAFGAEEAEEMLDVASPTPRGGGRFRRTPQRPPSGHHTEVLS